MSIPGIEQKTRLAALRTPSLPTPAELAGGLKGRRDYVMLGLLVGCALPLRATIRLAIVALYSNPGLKLMSSLYLYPGQTSAGTSSGFYVQQSGISVQRQCS
jgi:hypothetical protein